jgi:phosphatidylglycerophosphate synthase
MRIWIDATMPAAAERFFNVTLLEHLLRTVRSAEERTAGLKAAFKQLEALPEAARVLRREIRERSHPSSLRVELAEGSTLDRELPAELAARAIWSRSNASPGARLRDVLAGARGEPVIALAADTVVDPRVLDRLAWSETPAAFIAPQAQRGVALRLDADLSDACWEAIGAGGLDAIVREAVARGEVQPMPESAFARWIANLRRDLAPYAYRVSDRASCATAEDAVFWSNYKGSTDFLTRYVFPPFVRWALGPLTRHRVHPNAVTLVSIALALGAIPVFASGHWWIGLAMAFAMAALDSVDGKLARITFTSSPKGDVLDHGLDLVHPPFWYMAWGYGAAGGVASDPVFLATCAMLGIYILDRMIEKLFSAATGHPIAACEPIDVRMRTFISRRNVNLVLFTLGVVAGAPRAALWVILGWQIASALFHVVRLAQCWSAGGKRDAARGAEPETLTLEA